MAYSKKIVQLIGLATIVRCIIALFIELGNDEVYYLSYAQHLQWNYFDHPPMVALLIRITTVNGTFTHDFFIRLGPIVLSAINTWLVFKMAKQLNGDRAGWIAALLFTASPYCSMIAGLFILPDAPQLFFWLLSIKILINIAIETKNSKQVNSQLLLFGLLSGLCIMSKVHGVFLWIAFGAWVLFFNRSLLTNVCLYISAGITAAVISPIVIWNIHNNFITYTFHSNRVIINNGLQIDSFLREFAGGIAYNNPLVYILIVLTLYAVIKKRPFVSIPVKRLLLLLSLPLIIILLFIALFRDTLPHWSGPAYTVLIILAGCYIAWQLEVGVNKGIAWRRLAILANALVGMVIIVALPLIHYMPGTIGKKETAQLGEGDFTLDIYGWTEIRTLFEQVRAGDIKNKGNAPNFVINNKWFPGAHIDNYIAQPLGLNFLAIGTLEDIHTYDWLNKQRKQLPIGEDAYFITVSNSFTNPQTIYANQFEHIQQPVVVPQYRNGKPARYLYVYWCKGYKGLAQQGFIGY